MAHAQPLVIGHHLIWTAYGWWLPNDPRGSGSHSIRNDILTELGDLHYGRKKIQPTGAVVRAFQRDSALLLKQPRRVFDDAARLVVAESFATAIADEKYTCYACAIMPDHVHILIRKRKQSAEEMMRMLKGVSARKLHELGWCDTEERVWASGSGWKVFQDHPDEMRRTIRYIERNPIPIHLPLQRWSFVTEYDNWPLHPGHSSNSPYVRALRNAGRYP